MQFQQIKDDVSGLPIDDMVRFVDDSGVIWTVSEGHRFWDLYQKWLADGNTPAS